MDKETFKKIMMGIALAVVPAGLESCENNNENKDDNTKPQTEQIGFNIGNALGDIDYPTVKTASKENERDSILTGIDLVTDGSTLNYKNPTYSVKGKSDPRKGKLDVINVAADGKSIKFEFSYDEITPEDSIKKVEEKKNSVDSGMNETSNEGESRRNEFTTVNGSDERVVFEGKAITFNSSDPNEEQISAKQPNPEKKGPPKGSISKDAFTNAFLELNRKRGGRK